MDEEPATDHFLHRAFAGFTEAASPEHRLTVVRELSGFAYALRTPDIAVPDLEGRFPDQGIDLQLEIDDEDRFELSEDEIRSGARLRVFLEGHRWLIRLRDAESKRIIFQATLPWIDNVFGPRL